MDPSTDPAYKILGHSHKFVANLKELVNQIVAIFPNDPAIQKGQYEIEQACEWISRTTLVKEFMHAIASFRSEIKEKNETDLFHSHCGK
ncbi:hypothetical protein HDU78_005246 [Chytriomyces hyalinus]|nr:hypothetical protein HDU78_005246 [Chytriomyces hyalinus]